MFSKVFFVCLILGLALAASPKHQFQKFMKKYGKTYDANELPYRFQVFQENLRRAEEYQKKEKSYGARFGVTQFMDLTPQEFSTMYKMGNITSKMPYNPSALVKTDFSKKAKGFAPDPNNWDWFTQGVCTPVYNQGQCGSCWAFSATENIESYNVISAGAQLIGLSMEQIVDCDTTCYGCGGGWPYLAYNYVSEAGGIDSYSSYPYTAGEGQAGQCNFNAANIAAKVSSYTQVSGETGLYQQTSTTGPVSVCVDASSWQYYSGGILTQCTTNVDHCVQLTGYMNYGQSGAYWVVRNSWATSWGENGFIWIEIGQDLCAIGDYATVPTE
jgi:C1A family cysteine protease